ncbi:ABC transporter substrate-binding protein [Streptomyces tricolor]|nr:ABC transporter substrate-binding protein [Streptomyces tricolor]
MTWAPQDTDATNKPGMPAMALAYAKWVNSHGGIHGRRLEVLTCNDHNDSVGAAKCARRAAAETWSRSSAPTASSATPTSPRWKAPAIPYIGGYGVTNDEFTGSMSHPVNARPARPPGRPRQGPRGRLRQRSPWSGPTASPATSCPRAARLGPQGGRARGRRRPARRRGRHRVRRPGRAGAALRHRGTRRRRAVWCPRSGTAPTPSWTPSGGPARTSRTYAPRPCSAASTRP